MDRASVDRLRFDRRLERRRGWTEKGVREGHIESLPDVTDKMTRGFDEPEDSDQSAAPSAESAPQAGFASAEPAATPPAFGSTASTDPTSDPTSGSDPFSGGGSNLS